MHLYNLSIVYRATQEEGQNISLLSYLWSFKLFLRLIFALWNGKLPVGS